MIRRSLIACGLFGLSMGAVLAADISPIVVPASPPVVVASPSAGYSFAGPYVGIGIGWDPEDFCGPSPCNTEPPTRYPYAVIFGGYAGFNIQRGALVVGVDAFAGTVLPRGLTVYDGTQTNNSTVFHGFLRARAGVAFGPLLVYGTAGLAALAHDCPVCQGIGFGTGWTVGGGAEFGLSRALSMRLDYAYTNINNLEFPNGIQVGHTSHTVLLGLIYNFGR